jgi:hypothetical protein
MEACFKNNNLIIEYDNDKHTLFSYWYTSVDMRDEAYRKLLNIYLDSLRNYTPKNIVVNAHNAHFAVPVETQDWINLQVYPLYEKFEIQKLAVIISIDFIAQLSFEQIIDDSSSSHTQIRFFDNEENAISWIETVKDNRKRIA